jgi:peptidoglycan/LPS O-acetylase OafA/YrhL
MELAQEEKSPNALRLARHAVGIMIVAAANPAIYRADDRMMVWASTWIVAIGAAAAMFGFYALFFPKKARPAWPKSAIILGWVLLALVIFGAYQDGPQVVPKAPCGEVDTFLGLCK